VNVFSISKKLFLFVVFCAFVRAWTVALRFLARYSAPRRLLHLWQAPTQLLWSVGSAPLSCSITWSMVVARARLHQ
jgi:hypothetical protein